MFEIRNADDNKLKNPKDSEPSNQRITFRTPKSVPHVEYGVWIPVKIIEKGELGDYLRKNHLFKEFSIKHPNLGLFLEDLRNQLKLSYKQFAPLFGFSSGGYYGRVVDGHKGMKLQRFLTIYTNPIIQKSLREPELNKLKKEIEFYLTNNETLITLTNTKINFSPHNLEKVNVKNETYVILPTSKWEMKGEREKIKTWVKNFYKTQNVAPGNADVDSAFSGFRKSEMKRYRRTWNNFLRESGVPVRLDIKYDWSDSDTIRYLEGWIRQFLLDSGRLPILSEILEGFSKSFTYYLNRIGKSYGEFLIDLGYSVILEEKFDWIDPKTIKEVERWIQNYYDSFKKSPTCNDVIEQFSSGFFGYLRRNGKTWNEFLIERGFPTNYEVKYDWNNPNSIKMVRDWIKKFYLDNDKSPTLVELNNYFGRGFYQYLVRTGKRWNEILNEYGCPLNEEIQYDWLDPTTIEDVELWIGVYFEENGFSPTLDEVMRQFSYGFGTSYLRREGKTWNEFLLERGYTPRQEKIYSWTDPQTIKELETWIKNYFETYKDSPTFTDVEKEFSSGISYHLRKFGKTWNDYLTELGYPIHNVEQVKQEGNLFDTIGKEALPFLHKNILIDYRIFSPLFESYIIPDGILHNFSKTPLKIVAKSIFIQKNQKLDVFIDFKRSYAAISPKNFSVYPRIAKEIRFYLLKGGKNIPELEKDGCKIKFLSKENLINQLSSVLRSLNEEQIKLLIKRIYTLDKGVYNNAQKAIEEFL